MTRRDLFLLAAGLPLVATTSAPAAATTKKLAGVGALSDPLSFTVEWNFNEPVHRSLQAAFRTGTPVMFSNGGHEAEYVITDLDVSSGLDQLLMANITCRRSNDSSGGSIFSR